MKIDPASDASLIKLFVSVMVLVIICAIHKWAGERETARSLGHSAQYRPKLIGVEGPMTKAEAQIAALEDRAPNVQPEEQREELSVSEDVKAEGKQLVFR
jgi:hypothetical protein